jgi:hypothetical protein
MLCPSGRWVTPHQLDIDQAPVVVMIENYRSGLIWDTSCVAARPW